MQRKQEKIKKGWAVWGLYGLVLLSGCARFGAAPAGGPKDLAPPVLLQSLPQQGSRNFTAKEILLDFDEYIVLQNMDKIITSPVLSKVSYSANLKRLTVLVEDTLQEDRTYSINFKDAIGDLHESTPLRDYTYYFSTGSRIDSGRIVGAVRDAFTLEPVREAAVMFYADKPEGYPVRVFPDYVAVTDTGGVFRTEYMRDGCYYLLVSTDENKNYLVDPTEEKTAFSSDCWQTGTYRPPVYFEKRPGVKESDSAMRYTYDSAWQARRNEDRAEIASSGRELFLYQDKVAGMFLKEAKWSKPGEIDLNWYYTPDPDSLRLFFLPSYNDIESVRQLEAAASDTADENGRRPNRRQQRLEEQEVPDLTWPLSLRYFLIGQDDPLLAKVYFNNYAVRDLRLVLQYGSFSDTAELMLPEGMRRSLDTASFRISARQTTLFYKDSLLLDFSFPVIGTDLDKAALTRYHTDEEGKRDTLDIPVSELAYRLLQPNRIAVSYAWQPGNEYRLFLPSACFSDYFGRLADTANIRIVVPPLEDYGQVALSINLPDTTSPYVLQLVNQNKAVLQSVSVPADGQVEFPYVVPGYVSFVLIRDNNGNGRWDTGNYPEGIQPERRWFFSKVLQAEADWRIEERWSPGN